MKFSQSSPFRFVLCLFASGLFLVPIAQSRPVRSLLQDAVQGTNSQGEAFRRGLDALKEDRPEAALAELTAAEQEAPADARIRNFRGIVLARLRRHTEAAAEYREAIRLDPKMGDAYRNLGFLSWTEHDLDHARESLLRAVELSPKDSFAHYYLGRVELDRHSYAEAFRQLGLSDVPWPAEPGFLMQVAAGNLALGREEEAQKTLRQLVALPLTDSQSVRAAQLLLAAHENDGALGLIKKLRERQATPAPWAEFDLALGYLLAGSFEKVAGPAQDYINLLDSAKEDAARTVPGWSLVGIACARLGQENRALEALRNAAKLASDREELWLNLTRELMELNRYGEAISAAQEGLAANPKSYALHLRLGAANLSAGHYPDAETIFRTLVDAGDPLPSSYIGLAQVLLRTGRAGEAVSELSAAQQKLGANFLIAYFQGMALDRAGERVQAIAAFQEAIRLNPSNAEAHLELGKSELSLNRVSDAIAELEKALHLNPASVQARRLLSQAYQRAGDARRAEEYAGTTSEAPAQVEGDLLGDFVLPDWQLPEENKNDEASAPKGTV